MKVAIVGASGKTGRKLIEEALRRGYEVVGVCRDRSAGKLEEYKSSPGFSLLTAPQVSDESVIARAVSECDGVVAILVSILKLKATALVKSLIKATEDGKTSRMVFTAGEVTAVPDNDEVLTKRQRRMLKLLPGLLSLTPVSVTDMLKASELIKKQSQWRWTILRAPTLTMDSAKGYRVCELSEITSADTLSRDDYASLLLDTIDSVEYHNKILSVTSLNTC